MEQTNVDQRGGTRGMPGVRYILWEVWMCWVVVVLRWCWSPKHQDWQWRFFFPDFITKVAVKKSQWYRAEGSVVLNDEYLPWPYRFPRTQFIFSDLHCHTSVQISIKAIKHNTRTPTLRYGNYSPQWWKDTCRHLFHKESLALDLEEKLLGLVSYASAGWFELCVTSKWAPRFLQCKFKCCAISSMTCFLWVTSFFVVFLKSYQTVKLCDELQACSGCTLPLIQCELWLAGQGRGYGKLIIACLDSFVGFLESVSESTFLFHDVLFFLSSSLNYSCAYMASETVRSLQDETLQPSCTDHQCVHYILCSVTTVTQQNTSHWCPSNLEWAKSTKTEFSHFSVSFSVKSTHRKWFIGYHYIEHYFPSNNE